MVSTNPSFTHSHDASTFSRERMGEANIAAGPIRSKSCSSNRDCGVYWALCQERGLRAGFYPSSRFKAESTSTTFSRRDE
jgi:hypothetical protein